MGACIGPMGFCISISFYLRMPSFESRGRQLLDGRHHSLRRSLGLPTSPRSKSPPASIISRLGGHALLSGRVSRADAQGGHHGDQRRLRKTRRGARRRTALGSLANARSRAPHARPDRWRGRARNNNRALCAGKQILVARPYGWRRVHRTRRCVPGRAR